jgi:hypothetical protein
MARAGQRRCHSETAHELTNTPRVIRSPLAFPKASKGNTPPP